MRGDETIHRKLGVAMLAIAGLIVGLSLFLWMIGTLERPTSMLPGAGVLFLLGLIAISRPRDEDDGNS